MGARSASYVCLWLIELHDWIKSLACLNVGLELFLAPPTLVVQITTLTLCIDTCRIGTYSRGQVGGVKIL